MVKWIKSDSKVYLLYGILVKAKPNKKTEQWLTGASRGSKGLIRKKYREIGENDGTVHIFIVVMIILLDTFVKYNPTLKDWILLYVDFVSVIS